MLLNGKQTKNNSKVNKRHQETGENICNTDDTQKVNEFTYLKNSYQSVRKRNIPIEN